MTRRVVLALVITPVVTVIGAAAVVQGVIAWRTDRQANAATDRWLDHDFRLWAEELRRR